MSSSPGPRTVWFLGVATAGSMIHEALPRWGERLGQPLTVRGIDLRLGATKQDYERFCAELAASDAAGAVVTSHKSALYGAVSRRFDHLDETADLTGEINAIRRQGSGLLGWARDPVSVGRVVDQIWPEPGREVICLGAGGTSIALLAHLVRRPARPAAVTVCEISDEQLERMRAFLRRLSTDVPIDLVLGHPDTPWDGPVGRAGPGALIVNATGLGKDLPGAPISNHARFPRDGVVWELNYRGDLRFLSVARHRQSADRLSVHDGWQLFCHGWAAALTPVLGLPDEPDLADRFADAIIDLRAGSR